MSVNAVPQIATNWSLFLALGLVSTIAGILAIVYPDLTLLAIGIFAGVSLLFIGAMEIVDAIAGPPDTRAMSAIVVAFRLRNVGHHHEPGAAAPA